MTPRTIIAVTALTFAQPAIADGFYVACRIGVSSADDAADAARRTAAGPSQLPAEISLDGRPFDSSDTAAGLVVGWKAKPWLAIELAYTDLGESESNLELLAPLPLGVPVISPAPPASFLPAGPVAISAVPLDFNKATLAVEEWSIAARFSTNLVSSLSANWSLGISQAEFDAPAS